VKKPKKSFFANQIAMFGSIFMLVLGYPLAFFLMWVVPNSAIGESHDVAKMIMAVILLVVPTVYVIITFNIAFSKVMIDELGIHKSLLRRYFKKTILWTEVKEIKLYNRVDTWIFISKVPMGGMTYNQLLKHKDVIQLTAIRDVRDLITKYSKKDLNESNNT
jgi:hypothetical protein